MAWCLEAANQRAGVNIKILFVLGNMHRQTHQNKPDRSQPVGGKANAESLQQILDQACQRMNPDLSRPGLGWHMQMQMQM